VFSVKREPKRMDGVSQKKRVDDNSSCQNALLKESIKSVATLMSFSIDLLGEL